ncbi:hypothetical protein F53441_4426 [Fusarium austroafricanum]|uniref:Uncharacterized protein n=1 Tax=Fusarium austroafricanum TaxID=2364996 RepID=A0A8H4P9G9_9HYPO|nr:hypothetical protein F53441_4426 [Fusarium austroafricanum]
MPTYLCHGFRWHRRDIRIFVILNDLEDAAPNWILAPASSYCILDQLHAKYDFLPELSPPTTPTQKSVSIAKSSKAQKHFDHVDDDHALPASRVPDAEDAVLMHSWSPVKLLEEFDADEMTTAYRPYAYVADFVVRVDLSVDVAGQMAIYYDKMAGRDGWVVKLRNELQKGEPVRWYVVVCGDDVREVPGKSNEEEKEVGYEQIRDAAQTTVRNRRTKEASEGFSDSPSEYDEDNDRDEDEEEEEALTVLNGVLGESDGAATPRPLSHEFSDIDIPLQPQPDPNRASILTTSTIWSQAGSPNPMQRQVTPDIDAPLRPRDLDPKRTSISTAASVWSQKESSDDGLGLGTPSVEIPLLHSDNTRYSTSTASGLYSEYGNSQTEPEEFIKTQPSVQSPIREEVPDIVQPLEPNELLPSRSSTPPTPKVSQRQLPAPTTYRPESFIPPFSPSLAPMEGFDQESGRSNLPSKTEEIKPPEPTWPLSSDSPLESSGSSTFQNEDGAFPLVTSLMYSNDRLGSHLNLPKELVPPRTPSPTSEYSPQPQIFGSAMPKFEEIVPRAPLLLVSPNPARVEQPSSGVLHEAGDTVSEQQSPFTPPQPQVKHAPPLEINTKKAAKELASNPAPSVTPPTSARQKTPDPILKTPPGSPQIRLLVQKSPKSRLPRSIPKNIRISSVPLPPEPEIKTPRRPPTPPKPRSVQGGGLQKRPQTAPEESASSRTHTRGFSMPYRYEVPSSLQELQKELVLEPKPSLASGYGLGVNSGSSAPQDIAREVKIRTAQPASDTTESRQASVFTQHSDGQAPDRGKHPKQRIGRSHSVAEGLKRLFRKPSHAKGAHH